MKPLLNILKLCLIIITLSILAYGIASFSTELPVNDGGLSYPIHYRTEFTHYATIQRKDGTIRDLYVNSVGLSAIENNQPFPSGTVLVIESYSAQQNKSGEYRVDENGWYIKGDQFPMIHIREKRTRWASDDFISDTRNGSWNVGSFNTQTGQRFDESLDACFHCHSTARTDFTYSVNELADFTKLGQVQHILCTTTGRTPCE